MASLHLLDRHGKEIMQAESDQKFLRDIRAIQAKHDVGCQYAMLLPVVLARHPPSQLCQQHWELRYVYVDTIDNLFGNKLNANECSGHITTQLTKNVNSLSASSVSSAK